MLCLDGLMSRWRGSRDSEPCNRESCEGRARSRSLCLGAGDGSLLQLLHRRASTALSSASELIARRGVFSRRQYGSVEQLSQAGEGAAEADRSRRFRLENGNSLGEKDELFGPPSAPVLENPEFQTRWYFKYFLGKLHQNYIGLDASREPYLLSVVQEGGLLRAILFNKMGAHKISLGPSAWGAVGPERTRPPPKYILSHFPPIDRLDKAPREVTCPEIQKDILLLEEQEGSVNFKIGIIYAKKGQKTDDEMLSNESGDDKFDQFLALLGERVRLKGWSRFRGGLDVKGDMTGSHGIYTMHQGHEIMFHVSTMLPFSKDNKQQLERKRHIGNDIVNIVFTEDSTHADFNPLCIKSHFTHIFAVVSSTDCGPEGPGYRLSVFSDDSVPPFGPSLPFPAIFTDPQLFREFLLVKLMNGEKATFQTPTFALKRQRTLDSLIKDIYAEHCSDHKVPMLSRRALSDVWSSSRGAGSAGVVGAARSERFVRAGQALKLDAVLRGDAPTSLASGGMCGSRRAPWEATLWRAAPLPAAATCAVALPDGRLLLSTTSNTYILEESGTTRVVLRWEGCVRQARVAGGVALFRTVGRGAGLLALPLHELSAGAWAMRPHQDCKEQRLPRTKACHYIDTAELDDGRAIVAIAIGRRILLLVQDIKSDNEPSCDFTQTKDFQLSETPLLLRLLEGDVGMLVVGYKQHWEVLDRYSGQPIKRVVGDGPATGCVGAVGGAGGTEEGAGRRGRGTLVTALRLGDERDAQLLFCFNHTCHFERLTTDGLQSDSEYNFHWTTVPTAVVCAFPYIMAFAEDLLEIRLVANGSLVHAACIPGLRLLCAEQDIFYLACVPEYSGLREPDFGLYSSPASVPTSTTTTQESNQAQSKLGQEEDDCTDKKLQTGQEGCSSRLSDTTSASASSRSSSVSSEPDTRSPLQRLPQISPPNSPQVTTCHTDSSSSGRCVRIYKIPLCNLSAATYQRQSISTDGSNPFPSYRSDKLIDEVKLQNVRANKSRSSSTAIVSQITTS